MSAKTLFFFLFSLLLLTSIGCKKDTVTPPDQKARLLVKLTDGPGDYEAVNIDIQDVEVNPPDSSGWVSLDSIAPGVYDLIQLSGGLDTLLGTAELPAGQINQLRLILGNNNTVQIDSVLYPLKTPSGQQSGIKVQLNADLVAGVTYTVLLDFDAAQSVVKAGSSGNYNLKPVIRAIVEAESGSIQGKVSPAGVNTAAMAIDAASDTFSSYVDTLGHFLIRGVPAGTYDLLLQPAATSGYRDTTLSGILVNLGLSTDVGTISLPQ